MIIIKKNPNGDTRTAPTHVSFNEFAEANDMHIGDVRNVMHELSRFIDYRGTNHDYTKKSHELLFYDNFMSTKLNGTDFTKGEWYQLHIKEERHHLLSRCPEDVNLIDVLEMIVDCTCAGLARSGETRPLEISDDILRKAVDNTVGLIKSMIVLEETTGEFHAVSNLILLSAEDIEKIKEVSHQTPVWLSYKEE